MEKIITCTKCRKTFTVSGPYSRAKDVAQGVTCPFCAGPNDVMCPMDTGFTTIPILLGQVLAQLRMFLKGSLLPFQI